MRKIKRIEAGNSSTIKAIPEPFWEVICGTNPWPPLYWVMDGFQRLDYRLKMSLYIYVVTQGVELRPLVWLPHTMLSYLIYRIKDTVSQFITVIIGT